MIPKFPEFKRLEFSDKEEIEAITSQYEPYSDFDFTTLWSWDIQGHFKLSKLNGNLVLVLNEHFTDEPFYTFLGNNDINKTLKQLFAFPLPSKSNGPVLRLVPEASLKNINLKKYIIEIDLNNYDYIYDLRETSVYEGAKFADKRRMLNNFLRSHGAAAEVKILDPTDKDTKENILNLTRLWTDKKTKQEEGLNFEKEFIAIDRFLNVGFANTFCVAVYVNNNMVAYQIYTLLNKQYAICHFAKVDISFSGVFEYIMKESALILLEKGAVYLNYEEDLGLPGLRFSKNSFNPTSFLRKYFIKEL